MRNGLFSVGYVRRMMMIPPHTKTKANNVPMLVASPKIRIGTNAASPPVTPMNNKLDRQGVRNFRMDVAK